MPTPTPIALYADALLQLRGGDPGQAAQSLARALGAPTPSPIILDQLDDFLTPGTPHNDLVLRILATETAKGGT